MAGAFVFPGGKLDAGDSHDAILSRLSGRTPSECGALLGEQDLAKAAGLFVAAIRETFEEAGVLLADGDLDDDARTALQKGERSLWEFGQITLRLDALVPQARWITPEIEPRRYDTRFFLARVDAEQEARHDEIETTAGEWMEPAVALERAQAGEIQLPPPTMRTLEWLRARGSIDAAMEAALARPIPTIAPVVRDDDGAIVLALPGDPLHAEDEPTFGDGITRFVLDSGKWHSRDGRVG